MIPLVILTWNKPVITKDCIDSIEKFTDSGLLDIIVCDNNSTQPGMKEYLLELGQRYTVVRNKLNFKHAGWFPGIRLAFEKYPSLNYFLLSDPDIVLQDGIPGNWPEVFIKFLDRHKEVAKAGVLLDYESTEDPDIISYFRSINHGIYKTDMVPDPCYKMPISTTLSILRPDTFVDLFHSQINNHFYNPKYRGIIAIGGRFTCRHLGWEMYKEKYRNDLEFAWKQDSRTYMTSIRHLMGEKSFFNKKGTNFYKNRR